jgi:hypothetical protein
MRLRAILAAVVTSVCISLIPGGASAGGDTCAGNEPFERPDGTVVQYGAGIYLVRNCQKWPIPHPLDLQLNYFDQATRQISVQEFNALSNGPGWRAREGALIRNPNTGAIYIIDMVAPGSYVKRWISGTAWQLLFTPCGAQPTVNYDVDSLNYPDGPAIYAGDKRPDGQLVRASSSSTAVYVIEGGAKRLSAGPNHLASHNFQQPVCIDPNITYDTLYPPGPALMAREGTLAKGTTDHIYIIDDLGAGTYRKRHIAGLEAYTYYGFSSARNWPNTDINAYTSGNHAHPVKTLFTGRWYKNLRTSALTAHREYLCTGCDTAWGPAITAARDAWNNAPTPVFFNEVAYSLTNDVRIKVAYWNSGRHGYVVPLQSDGQPCPNGDPNACPGGVWYKMEARMDHGVAPASYRKAATSHELGHAIVLAHDGLGNNWYEGDDLCAGKNYSTSPPSQAPIRVPTTIMDYDCYVHFVVDGPAGWDSCGINHAYYTSIYQYSGC